MKKGATLLGGLIAMISLNAFSLAYAETLQTENVFVSHPVAYAELGGALRPIGPGANQTRPFIGKSLFGWAFSIDISNRVAVKSARFYRSEGHLTLSDGRCLKTATYEAGGTGTMTVVADSCYAEPEPASSRVCEGEILVGLRLSAAFDYRGYSAWTDPSGHSSQIVRCDADDRAIVVSTLPFKVTAIDVLPSPHIGAGERVTVYGVFRKKPIILSLNVPGTLY